MGTLCFVDGDWPLFGGTFTIDLSARAVAKSAAKQLIRPGSLGDAQHRTLHRSLAAAFPTA